jgi:hypothetical protein
VCQAIAAEIGETIKNLGLIILIAAETLCLSPCRGRWSLPSSVAEFIEAEK